MQAHGHPRIEVVINGSLQSTNGTEAKRLRPLSVDEALQYSPLTTSITSGLERIPLPDLGPRRTYSGLVDDDQRRRVNRLVGNSKNAASTENSAGSDIHLLHKGISSLLVPDDISEYKLKPMPAPELLILPSPDLNSKPTPYKPKLSPLADMVLASSAVAYRYPTPSTPSPKLSTTRLHKHPTPAVSRTPEHTVTSHNQASHQKNGLQPMRNQNLMVDIPPKGPSERTSNAEFSPKRRKLNSSESTVQVVIHQQAQKDETEAALSRFQEFLTDILTTHDRLQPDTSDATSFQSNPYFEEPDCTEDSTVKLASKVHSKLQNAIKKLTASQKFKELPSDDIKKLQNICEHSILRAQVINLQVSDDPSEDDVDHWRQAISVAENGSTSACTLAWTILGSLENKELCPDDLIQCIPILLTNIFESCILPIVEARAGGRNASLFKLAASYKELLTRLLHQSRKLLSLMADICLEMESAETAITRVEYLATQLIFAESSVTEKDSVLGLQLFETVRKSAMEALAKIFSRFVDQRQSILDEILSSLQKLSTTKQGARQFKLIDGKNIQLVSALVMQLVQTVASETAEQRSKREGRLQGSKALEDSSTESEEEDFENEMQEPRAEEGLSSIEALSRKASALHQKAVESANYIINYFVQRAKFSTKTGDQPHRNLLDLFTEDLIGVLGSPDWPAAELLLWILARHMLIIMNDDKSGATPKNMALELLGWMGSAISNLLVSVQGMCATTEKQGSVVGRYLADLVEDQLRGSLHLEDVVTANGPFRIALECFKDGSQGAWQRKTARGFLLTVWAKTLTSSIGDAQEQNLAETEKLATLLLRSLSRTAWLDEDRVLDEVTQQQARLGYLMTVINLNFCRVFDVIVKILLQSLTSDQAKMRSRSLKSVIAMLEADPKLLDRDAGVMNVIFRCASDPSPMVRDNALSLIAKCMSLRPVLEEDATRVILDRCRSDPAVGVRKRCLAILKDVYLRNSKLNQKAEIARAFLQRLNDPEDAVVTLAYQALFEVWITPFLIPNQDISNSAKSRVALTEQVYLIVKTIHIAENAHAVELLARLEQFYKRALEEGPKGNLAVSPLCSSVVEILFDLVLNSPASSSKQEQKALLSTLQAFAKADSNLVKPEQLQALQPYIQNLSTDDDLFFFRSVVVIYRCVLPRSSDKILLKAIQDNLMRAVSKLGRAELNEAIACLWTIDRVLCNTERLVKLTVSLLKNISGTKLPTDASAPDYKTKVADISRRLRSYVRIAGFMGKHCDLEPFSKPFRDAFPSWKGTSVTGLMVDLIYPLMGAEQLAAVKAEALHSLASICQSWPGQFNKEPVRDSFSSVLRGTNPDLQSIILNMFLDFFTARELLSETVVTSQNGATDQDGGRLDGSLRASDHDGAAALIAQHFLSHVLRLAISGDERIDTPAIEVIASINRQGLVHPKECAGALIALETSPRLHLANVAHESHRLLHQQHETMFEREYMRAIHEAYVYQRDVGKDPMGAKARPFVSKLASLYEIIKTSNLKYVRKFLKNLVTKVSADAAEIAIPDNPTDNVLFCRFLLQNIAFFEYGKLDELVHVLSLLESYVGKVGVETAQAIEAQGLGKDTSTDLQQGSEQNDLPSSTRFERVDPKLLERLTVPAMILTMLWEARTHLRRQYGIVGRVHEREGKAKDAKELAKPPAKVHGITGERFWENVASIMTSLDSEESMRHRCFVFTQLMAIDDEVKVAAEGDEMRDSYSASVDPEGSLLAVPGIKAKKKRKSSASAAGTPKKKRGRPSLNGKRRSSVNPDTEEDWD